MRRLYRINSAPDFSGWSEPIVILGATPLSLKNLAAIALGIAVAGTGFLMGGSILLTRPVPLTLGGLLGLTAGLGLIILSSLSRPDQTGLPILALLLGKPSSYSKASSRGIERQLITIQAAKDIGLAKIELEGYAFNPASGEPLEKVDITVNGKLYSVETRSGKYYLVLELQRGVYEIKVLLHGTRVTLRRYYVRVI